VRRTCDAPRSPRADAQPTPGLTPIINAVASRREAAPDPAVIAKAAGDAPRVGPDMKPVEQ
jgi:hypothetical protein